MHPNLFLSLFLYLLPFLISASESNTTPLKRQAPVHGCDIQPIATEAGAIALHSCGNPGWGFVSSCGCCGIDNACVIGVQSCGQDDLCYNMYSIIDPPPSPVTNEIISQGTPTAGGAATISTPSQNPSIGSVGKSTGSMSLQKADIFIAIFATGLLLAFGYAF
jgi:hypothetical protein